ncbi:MAG: alpha-amylase family glycosyl hydrolase, partial [Planctomycetota bacterium]
WGYSTAGFFAPDGRYCVRPDAGAHLDEFCDMVKACHREGIEVLLDVVFNHTDEGNHEGPTISLRGLDNSVYYYLVERDRQYYLDFSGCGNTLNCNHPISAKLVRDCLEFWAGELHVDGFRFDEGTILSRGEDGSPLRHPPLLWDIELSETLADTKLIAESWDAGGLYEVGSFPGYRWGEWNGKLRDAIRRFVRGDFGVVGEVATRLAGSADIYSHDRHGPQKRVNFVTCHDGFTLRDLVSYNGKHNEANGEDNRDGIDENFSWNCGAEGETDEAAILALRRRQQRNFLVLLMVAQGVPMILSGDEAGRTQRGNNNAYCQDNEISWFDWRLTERNADLVRFARELIAFRRRNACLRRPEFFTGALNGRGRPDVAWHGCLLNAPGWNDPACRVLALTLGAFEPDAPDLHLMFNMDDSPLAFELPEGGWRRFADTSLPSPGDIASPGAEAPVSGREYVVNPKSSVILIHVPDASGGKRGLGQPGARPQRRRGDFAGIPRRKIER